MEQTNSDHHHHVAIQISEIEMEESPKLLKMPGAEACSIFEVPQRLVRHNEKAYEPSFVSIGPYHHGKDNLKMIQEHKPRYLKLFEKRFDVDRQKLFDAVSSIEGKIRDSYSKEIDKTKEELTKMMVLDGCFILTLLSFNSGTRPYNDPIFNCPWIVPYLGCDFLLLENQIPFLVLHTLLQTSWISQEDNVWESRLLNEMVGKFYAPVLNRAWGLGRSYANVKAKHILDFLRQVFNPNENHQETPNLRGEKCRYFRSFWPIPKQKQESAKRPLNIPSILSASKLHRRGIKFKPTEKNEGMLDIKYEKGVLHIPLLEINNYVTAFLLNSIAFEQFYRGGAMYITSYAVFMAYLLNSSVDASFLCNTGIVVNFSETDEEVSRLFKNIQKEVLWVCNRCYLKEVYKEVDEYSSKGWHVEWAEFKHTYFDHPWTILSSVAALILLLLTISQTYFAADSHFRPPK